MAEIVRAGLVQQRWTGDKESMIAAAVDHIRTAASAGAQVVCLQELFYGPYFCQVQDADYYSYTEAIPDGPTTRLLQDVARQQGIVIIAPMYEEEHPGVYYNTAAVIDADGSYLGKYRKTPHPAGQGVLGEVLLPPGQPGLPGVRHRGGPDRRVHLLRPALPRGLAGARPGRRADRVQPVGHQPGPVPVPVAAGAARRGGGQRVLRRRDQPGRHRAARRQRLLRADLLRGSARPARGRRRRRRQGRGGGPRPGHGSAGRGPEPVAVLPRPPPRPVRDAGQP